MQGVFYEKKYSRFFIIFQAIINLSSYGEEKINIKLSFEKGTAIMSMEKNAAAKDFIKKCL